MQSPVVCLLFNGSKFVKHDMKTLNTEMCYWDKQMYLLETVIKSTIQI